MMTFFRLHVDIVSTRVCHENIQAVSLHVAGSCGFGEGEWYKFGSGVIDEEQPRFGV
jgi:hypothetical protein